MAPPMLDDPLLLRFAADKPDEMAALLGSCDLSELSELIEGLPLVSAASLSVRLPSWQLNGLLGTLEPALIGQMLITAQSDEAVALASHLHESRYPAILEAVPAEQRRALNELLEFPSHSVATLATKDFIRVQENMTCGDFSEQLSSRADTDPLPVLVVDMQGKYRGMLNLQAAYARKNRVLPVGEVAIEVEALNGLTDAHNALSARQWMKHPELPVVDGRHRVLGVVSRPSLVRVAGNADSLEFDFEQVLAELATGYMDTCASVLDSVLGKRK